ncbi:cytochrome P450 [Streptomyces bambusae]|uniref:cytochrome P450 n=1 Tax=Streptomyces bambusae TaxID=1550616 RepID=UPI001CFEB1B8|nr:cytochrome P450 [Streptomyces bambusae]MCB5167707.1 cytochrome P450 [Streptomyces bambusae]
MVTPAGTGPAPALAPVPLPDAAADPADPAGTAGEAAATAAAAAVLPEADAAAVRRWQDEGGHLAGLLARVRERAGGVAAFSVGGRRTVLVTDPRAVQHVLALHPDRYVKRSHRARMLVGDGVLAATGDAWQRQRKLLQGQFTGPGMRRHEHRIAAAARTAAARWETYARTGEEFDLGAEMRRFALDTIWRCLTGHPLDPATEGALGSVTDVMAALPTLPATGSGSPGAAGTASAPAPVTPPPAVAAELARIDAVARHAVAAARRGSAGPDGPGLLHVLVDASGTRPEYTDALIRDELVTLLVAGHETTATTLTWLHLLLDRHPQARADALAAGPAGSPERRRAVQALVSETLRLYPSAWILPRHAPQDDVLAGYAVPAGTDVLVCPYLTHRDPELWPDPEAFDPRRFTAPGRRPTGPGGYLPFGIGPRACLGTQFALRESTDLLELLLPGYVPQFRTTPSGTSFGITVRPDGPTPATLTLPAPPAR